MTPLSAVSLRAYRRARSLRLRAGIARTFRPLFLVFSGLMLGLEVIFLYHAFAHPFTADAAQVLIGSVCLAFCFLAVFFYGSRKSLGGLLAPQPRRCFLCAGNRREILFFQNAPVM